MRTTVTLDDDVVAAVEQMRAQRRLGLSAALNELARRGMAERPDARRFEQRVSDGGARMDVSNVAVVLDLVEDRGAR
ncbi:hypothetical protein GCM10027062_41980 [Nocardioides hungaricus]